MVVAGFFILAMIVFIGRFFQLQVLDYPTYKVLASDQHEVQASLIPKRGTIFVRDRVDGKRYPIALDRDAWNVFAVPRDMKEPAAVVKEIAPILGFAENDLLAKFTPTSTFMYLAKDVPLETVDAINRLRPPGIGVVKVQLRSYPEHGIGGQFLGFVKTDENNQRVGQYGVEGFQQTLLAGEYGSIIAEKDAAGQRLSIGTIQLKESRNGSDVVLTIDRAIQYEVCRKIEEAVHEYGAEQGSAVVMDPDTGAVVAMCSFPDFKPEQFNQISDLGVLNNPAIFYQYEPGSIFKPITLAAGIDQEKITPESTYVDKGEETMDDFTIRNSDKLAHGVQTMTEVLEKSLNTGAIHVQRLLGKELFRDYVAKFGLGEKSGIEMQTEVKGNISSLTKKGQIFAATASFGQGISVTPLQMTTAFAALGNGGKLLRPHIVERIISPDGAEEIVKPQAVRQVISQRASRLISAMMVQVVENGHGKKAAVPGYYVAGKTGTAQIPNPKGKGYLADGTIGTFAGYAPADRPKFVLLVKIDKPKELQYAEASAAPVFGEIAKFLLNYYQVPPERPVAAEKPLPPVPIRTTSTAATGTR